MTVHRPASRLVGLLAALPPCRLSVLSACRYTSLPGQLRGCPPSCPGYLTALLRPTRPPADPICLVLPPYSNRLCVYPPPIAHFHLPACIPQYLIPTYPFTRRHYMHSGSIRPQTLVFLHADRFYSPAGARSSSTHKPPPPFSSRTLSSILQRARSPTRVPNLTLAPFQRSLPSSALPMPYATPIRCGSRSALPVSDRAAMRMQSNRWATSRR